MPRDHFGREIEPGDSVVRAVRHGSAAPYLEVCEVRSITSDNKVYLNKSRVPIVFPERLMVINEVQECL